MTLTVTKINIQQDHSSTIAALQNWRAEAERCGIEAFQMSGPDAIQQASNMSSLLSLITHTFGLLKAKTSLSDFYVAQQGSSLHGMMIVKAGAKTAREITVLFVNPAFVDVTNRNRKVPHIGRALITECAREMVLQDDARSLIVQSLPHTTGFYEKLCFRPMNHPEYDRYYSISEYQRNQHYASFRIACIIAAYLALPKEGARYAFEQFFRNSLV